MSERKKYKLLIKGTHNGKPFQKTTIDYDWGEYWWAEGNGACDCNRGFLVGKELPCYTEGGQVVKIDTITPIAKNSKVKPVILNESIGVNLST